MALGMARTIQSAVAPFEGHKGYSCLGSSLVIPVCTHRHSSRQFTSNISMLTAFCFLLLFAISTVCTLSSGERSTLMNMETVHRKLIADNPAWHHVLNYILHGADHQDGRGWYYEPSGSTSDDQEASECCQTDHSGRWCRRRRPQQHRQQNQTGGWHAGDIPSGAGDIGYPNHHQLGYRLSRHVDELYNSTDWGPSCSAQQQYLEVVDDDHPPPTPPTADMDDAIDKLMRSNSNLPALYSILLNFGMNQYYSFLISLQNYLGEDHGCVTGTLWDPFYSSCRKVYCNPEDKLSAADADPQCNRTVDWEGECFVRQQVVRLTLFTEAIYDNATMSEGELLDTISAWFTPAFSSFVGIDGSRIANLTVGVVANNSAPSSTDEVVSLTIAFDLSQASDDDMGAPSIDSVVAVVGSLIVQDDLVAVVEGVAVKLVGVHEQPPPSANDQFINWCRGGTWTTYFTGEFRIDVTNCSQCDDPVSQTEFKVYIPMTDEWYASGEFLANVLFTGPLGENVDPANGSVSGYVVVCANRSVLTDTTCPIIRLNQSEFAFADDDSRTVVYTGELSLIPSLLLPGQYESLPNGDLAVCLNLVQEWPLVIVVESYLSTVLTSISIAAMTITITTYLLFRELRNLPGLAVLNLTASTCLFQLLFLLGERRAVYVNHHGLCVAVAIALHYGVLVSILWTNVMAVDLYLTLSRWSAVPRSSTKMLPRYALYAYGLPALIVSVSSCIHFCECTGDFSIDYGRFVCLLTRPVANILFVGLPVGLALLANLVFFVRTLVIIREASASIKKQGNNANHRRQRVIGQVDIKVKVYARMCTVMGFAWLIGMISSNLGDVSTLGLILAYVYTVANSLQGVFIFIAFTCNSRVVGLYKQRWGRDDRRPTAPTTADQRVQLRQLKTVSIETLVSNCGAENQAHEPKVDAVPTESDVHI